LIPSKRRMLKRNLSSHYLGENIHNQFSQIYTDVLQSIAEKDEEYLKGIMEPRLYERTLKGWENLEKKDQTLNYI
jgi:hypothetical protein